MAGQCAELIEVPWSGELPSPLVQVISPGRSGTRWLADVALSCTPHPVIHAQTGSLAEIGFLRDRGSIGTDEAFGAYLHARLRVFAHCLAAGCGLIDLDCKISPLAPVLMDRLPGMRFAVALRDPIAFVRSGIARGYFHDLDPQVHGHLCTSVSAEPAGLGPQPGVRERALLIARFWNRVARIGQALHASSPSRVVLLNMPAMFSSRSETASTLGGLGLHVDRRRLNAYSNFDHVKNANPVRVRPPDEIGNLESEVRQVALESIAAEFLAGCGISADT
jgi:hypothetical protein